MAKEFKELLKFGAQGETYIFQRLRELGCSIIPFSRYVDSNLGPRIYNNNENYVLPDNLININGMLVSFVEVKRKNGFTQFHNGCKRHHIKDEFQTGIDVKYFNDYEKVSKLLNLPVLIFFIQEGKPTTSSVTSPKGLYALSVSELRNIIDDNLPVYAVNNYGKGGVYYWCERDLIKLLSLDELFGIIPIESPKLVLDKLIEIVRRSQGNHTSQEHILNDIKSNTPKMTSTSRKRIAMEKVTHQLDEWI